MVCKSPRKTWQLNPLSPCPLQPTIVPYSPPHPPRYSHKNQLKVLEIAHHSKHRKPHRTLPGFHYRFIDHLLPSGETGSTRGFLATEVKVLVGGGGPERKGVSDYQQYTRGSRLRGQMVNESALHNQDIALLISSIRSDLQQVKVPKGRSCKTVNQHRTLPRECSLPRGSIGHSSKIPSIPPQTPAEAAPALRYPGEIGLPQLSQSCPAKVLPQGTERGMSITLSSGSSWWSVGLIVEGFESCWISV